MEKSPEQIEQERTANLAKVGIYDPEDYRKNFLPEAPEEPGDDPTGGWDGPEPTSAFNFVADNPPSGPFPEAFLLPEDFDRMHQKEGW